MIYEGVKKEQALAKLRRENVIIPSTVIIEDITSDVPVAVPPTSGQVTGKKDS